MNDNLQQAIIVTNANFKDLKIGKETFEGLDQDLKRIANILALSIKFNGKEVEDVRRLVFNYKNLVSPVNISKFTYYSFIPDEVEFI
jgi:hypothetical protein